LLFKKKNTKRQDDRVWATEAAKFEGISDEVIRATETGTPVLVIAHFRNTMENAIDTMERRGIQFDAVLDRWQMAQFEFVSLKPAQVLAFLSELALGQSRSGSRHRKELSAGEKLHVIMVEHYPIPDRDNEILSFSESLPRGSTIRFHSSLDESLLEAFGANRTFGLLSKLGWERTGYMENPSITKAIESGQTRIKRVAASNEKVNSQREWLYYNCPVLRDPTK